MGKSHFRSFAILVGLLAFAAAGWGLRDNWEQPADAYWTQASFSPPLAQVADRVEIWVNEEPLLKAVGEERLALRQGGAEATVAASRLVARVNNYDRARLERVPTMLAFAALAGGGLVLLLVGLFVPLISALRAPSLVDLHLEA